MIWKLGDRVVLHRCDVPENQEILGKVVVVITLPGNLSPHWMDVERDGVVYSVRGAECRPARPSDP